MTGRTPEGHDAPRRVLVVTGLSGAGKSSVLRLLEDLGYESVDNAPLETFDDIVSYTRRPLVIGVDSRTSGFSAATLLRNIELIKSRKGLRVELIYATAEQDTLLRRYTATRRKHPLSDRYGNIKDAICAEESLIRPLREVADVVIDTSDLPLPELRILINMRYGLGHHEEEELSVSLMSFAFSAGIPREADMVFDARFLRNPFYNPELEPKTGRDEEVAAYIQQDPDYGAFLEQIKRLLALVLPRFVQEGKKYATIAIGCSGGRHRSVCLVEELSHYLTSAEGLNYTGPVVVMHRELARQGRDAWRWVNRRCGKPPRNDTPRPGG